MAEITKNIIKEAVREVLEPFALAIQGDLGLLKKDAGELKAGMRGLDERVSELAVKVDDDAAYTRKEIRALRRSA